MTGDPQPLPLAHQTSPEAESGPKILLIPLGSTEQHGPHLPLATDTIIATHWCERAIAARDDVVAGPALPYGSSGEHQAFAGTLSMGTEALTTVLIELGRSAIPPFDRLVFVNGHGGNASALGAAVELLRSEARAVDALWPRLKGDAHAGRTETSLLLAAVPELVRLDRAEPGNTAPLAELLDALRADGLAPVAANGVLGDPTTADAEHGRQLWRELDSQLATLLDRGRPDVGSPGRV